MRCRPIKQEIPSRPSSIGRRSAPPGRGPGRRTARPSSCCRCGHHNLLAGQTATLGHRLLRAPLRPSRPTPPAHPQRRHHPPDNGDSIQLIQERAGCLPMTLAKIAPGVWAGRESARRILVVRRDPRRGTDGISGRRPEAATEFDHVLRKGNGEFSSIPLDRLCWGACQGWPSARTSCSGGHARSLCAGLRSVRCPPLLAMAELLERIP
jgi:hypothetical protein